MICCTLLHSACTYLHAVCCEDVRTVTPAPPLDCDGSDGWIV